MSSVKSSDVVVLSRLSVMSFTKRIKSIGPTYLILCYNQRHMQRYMLYEYEIQPIGPTLKLDRFGNDHRTISTGSGNCSQARNPFPKIVPKCIESDDAGGN